jgi:Iron only hydrogenase large subunit, C-terminal domain
MSEDEKSEIFPMISTTCPVVVRLIQMKYRALISHLVTLDSPLELTAQYAIDYLCQKLQIKKSLIYICYISPCPARVTSVINPLWKKKSLISTCVGTHDVYPQLRSLLNKIEHHDSLTHEEERAIRISEPEGLQCAAIGGESTGMKIDNYLSVDGIENVIDILEEIDRENIKKIAYVEATCCFGGCIGGPLTVMNRFAAQAKLREHVHDFYMEKQLFPQLIVHEEDIIPQVWELPLPENHAMRLSENIGEAMTKYEQIDEILSTLPQLDCGACGAPSCAAMAEDIVQGRASIDNCIIRQKRMKKE